MRKIRKFFQIGLIFGFLVCSVQLIMGTPVSKEVSTESVSVQKTNEKYENLFGTKEGFSETDAKVLSKEIDYTWCPLSSDTQGYTAYWEPVEKDIKGSVIVNSSGYPEGTKVLVRFWAAENNSTAKEWELFSKDKDKPLAEWGGTTNRFLVDANNIIQVANPDSARYMKVSVRMAKEDGTWLEPTCDLSPEIIEIGSGDTDLTQLSCDKVRFSFQGYSRNSVYAIYLDDVFDSNIHPGTSEGNFEVNVKNASKIRVETASKSGPSSSVTELNLNVCSLDGNIHLKYVDEEGNELTKSIDKKGAIDSPYTTEEKSFDGYELVSTPSNKEGTYKEYDQNVIYIYRKKEKEPKPADGNVIVKYVDENGKKLTTDIIMSDSIGLDYSTEQKVFDGYEFESVTDNKDGKYKLQDQVVIYVYKLKSEEAAKGSVVVKYVDDEGNPLDIDVTMKDDIDESYITMQKEFSDYEFVSVTENKNGVFDEEEQTVIYVYRKVVKEYEIRGNVIVQHVDDAGLPLHDNFYLADDIGNAYITNRQFIDGYELVSVTDNHVGNFEVKDQYVKYVYRPKDSAKPLEPVEPVKPSTSVPSTNTNDTSNTIMYYALLLGSISGVLILKKLRKEER